MRKRRVLAFLIAVGTTVVALTAATGAVATPAWVLEQTVTAGTTAEQRAPSYGSGRLAWEDDRGGDWDIYLTDLADGWSSSPIPAGAGNQRHPAVSPDSPWVAYEDDRNGNWDIYAYNWDAGTEVLVAKGTADQLDPAVSGTRVVYEARQNGGSDIRIFDLLKRTTSTLANGAAAQVDPAIAGSIVVWADRSAGNWDIVARDLRRSSSARITANRADQTAPCIQGGRVVYADDRNDASDVYLYSLATGSERRITTNGHAQTSPAICGDWVVYRDDRAGNADIYCTNIVAGVEKQVTDDLSPQAAPAVWRSHEYPRVVWRDQRAGDSDIYFAGLRMPYLSASAPDPAVVAYNHMSEVRCDFQGDNDNLVPGALLWRYDWSKGVAHKTAQSADAADGSALLQLSHLVRKTSFRVVFRGDERYAPLAGPVLSVDVRASLSGVGWKVRQLSGGRRSVRIFGTIRPRHAAGSRVVKVAVYSVHGSSRSLKATPWATAANGSATSSAFASTVTLPPGAYQLRVVHDDADHALTVFDDDNGIYAGIVRVLL